MGERLVVLSYVNSLNGNVPWHVQDGSVRRSNTAWRCRLTRLFSPQTAGTPLCDVLVLDLTGILALFGTYRNARDPKE